MLAALSQQRRDALDVAPQKAERLLKLLREQRLRAAPVVRGREQPLC